MSVKVAEALARIRNSDASGINHDDIYGRGDYSHCCAILAREYIRHPQGELEADLAMLIRRLCRELLLVKRDSTVAASAMKFLDKHGLQGNVIRTTETDL